MKDVTDVFGNLSGELFKPEIQGNRKVPIDSSDIDFATVRFANKRPGHASRTAPGLKYSPKER